MQVPLALLLSSNATSPGVTTPSTVPGNLHTQQPAMGFGAPLQRFGNAYQHHPPHQNNSPAMTPTSSTIQSALETETGDDEISYIVARLGGWLQVATEKEVKQWIVLKNTDLRAGEHWLLHVSRAARRVRALV
jgi:hypothetical protein